MPVELLLKAATPLMIDLAREALDEIFPGGNESQVKSGLVMLANKGLLQLPNSGSARDFIGEVQSAIEKLENKLGIQGIGKFTQELIAAELKKGCKGLLQNEDQFLRDQILLPAGDDDSRKIRYWVDVASFPDSMPDSLELIREAWSEWARYLKMNILEVGEDDPHNVRIFAQKLDGEGGDLADAHKGPPGTFKNELRFDTSEDWDQEKFLYAAIHEMGHLLGLGHTDSPGQIMSSKRQLIPPALTEEDVNRMLTEVKVAEGSDESYWKPIDPSPELDDEIRRYVENGSPINRDVG